MAFLWHTMLYDPANRLGPWRWKLQVLPKHF